MSNTLRCSQNVGFDALFHAMHKGDKNIEGALISTLVTDIADVHSRTLVRGGGRPMP